MAIIHLRNGVLFMEINRWILGDLLELMEEQIPPDETEVHEKLVQAYCYSALQLHLYEPAVAERLEKVLLRVAHAIVDGRLPLPSARFRDPVRREGFMRSMRELLKVMVHPVEGPASPEK